MIIIALVKIFSIIIGLTAISKTYYDYKKHRESMVMFLFWTITWVLIVTASLFPSLIISFISKNGDNGVGAGTFIGVAFVFVFFIAYRVYVKANRLEQDIKRIVMELGTKDIKKQL